MTAFGSVPWLHTHKQSSPAISIYCDLDRSNRSPSVHHGNFSVLEHNQHGSRKKSNHPHFQALQLSQPRRTAASSAAVSLMLFANCCLRAFAPFSQVLFLLGCQLVVLVPHRFEFSLYYPFLQLFRPCIDF